MAHFRRSIESFSPTRTVKIIGTECVEDHTAYVIEVSVGLYKWTVRRRYSEFFDLHEKLTRQYKTLDKNLLPKKKFFGNQTEQFIKKRQTELETYLQLLVRSLPVIPPSFVLFLDFHKYEIHGITQSLSEHLFEKGESILEAEGTFHMTPLQLNALCMRLELPEPPCDSGDARKDISHLLDFITRVQHLQINGSTLPMGSSNINMNELTYDLHCFKSLKSLKFMRCNVEKLSSVEHLKKSLVCLRACQSLLSLKDILLIGVGTNGHWLSQSEPLIVHAWSALTSADFSQNRISVIDESVKLMPRVEKLNLSHNRLEEVNNLEHLSNLHSLFLSHNLIRSLPALHTKLGNISVLVLSHNKLDSLHGLSKVYSLVKLDVSFNDITLVAEVKNLNSLPCLETLDIRNNPITSIIDYRMTILELFGDRAKELCLDGKNSTERELEMVAVRVALCKSRESKSEKRKQARKAVVKEATIVEMPSATVDGNQTTAAILPSSSSSISQDVISVPSNSSLSAEVVVAEEATESLNVAAVAPSESSSSLVPNEPMSRAPRGNQTMMAPSNIDISTLNTSDPKIFRQQIAHLQKTGGPFWLRQLNQMLHETRIKERSKAAADLDESIETTTENDENSSSDQGRLFFPLGHQLPNNHSSKRILMTDEQSVQPPKTNSYFMLPETLPSCTDKSFLAAIQGMLPKCLQSSDQDPNKAQPIHVMWCMAICYDDPFTEFSACVYLTTEHLHIFKVSRLLNDTGIPKMHHKFYALLPSIKVVAVGYDGLYVQVEEESSGSSGTYTLLTFNSKKTDLFVDAVKRAFRRRVPDLDDYEDPNIVSAGDVEYILKQTLNRYEFLKDPASLRITLYMLVFLVTDNFENSFLGTSALVMTSRYIYVLRQDFSNLPSPTFVSHPPSTLSFEVLAIFPFSCRIINIQMYDTDTIESGSQSIPTTSLSNHLYSSQNSFIGYGVRLSFHLGAYGIQTLDLRFLTSNLRDRFLFMLSQMRNEITDSLSVSKVKVKTVTSADQESGSSGSGSGKKPKSQHRKNAKKTAGMTNSLHQDVSGQNEFGQTTQYDWKRLPPSITPVPGFPSAEANLGSDEMLPKSTFEDIAQSENVLDISINLDCERTHIGDIQAASHPSPKYSVDEVSCLNESAFDASSADLHSNVNASLTDVPERLDMSMNDPPAMLDISYPPNILDTPSTNIPARMDMPSTDITARLGSSLSDPPAGSDTPAASLPSNTDIDPVVSYTNIDNDLTSMLDPPLEHSLVQIDNTRINLTTTEKHADEEEINTLQTSMILEKEIKIPLEPEVETSESLQFDEVEKDIEISHSPSTQSITDKMVFGDEDGDNGVSAANSLVHDGIDEVNVGNQALIGSSFPNVSDEKESETSVTCENELSLSIERLSPASNSLSANFPAGGYPSKELLVRLSDCLTISPLLLPISAMLEAVMSMSGLELVNFFHTNIAMIGTDNEELCHVLWTSVVMHQNPIVEIPTCVMISTKAIYFVSDAQEGSSFVDDQESTRQTHVRHSSGEQPPLQSSKKSKAKHLSCGILNEMPGKRNKNLIKSYAHIILKELEQVDLGMFGQSFRLTGCKGRQILACITRDCRLTDEFLRHLMDVVSKINPESIPNASKNTDRDIYSFLNRSGDVKQFYNIQFVYPPDDIVSDISILVYECLLGRKSKSNDLKILFYLLCHQLDTPVDHSDLAVLSVAQPKSLILTEEHLSFANEDHVSYPLPEFIRMPPDRPQTEIVEVRYLEFLRCIVLSKHNAHIATFVFSDETGEIVVDTSVDHFGNSQSKAPVSEVSRTLAIQNPKDRDKLIKLITQQWEEQHNGQQLLINFMP